MGHGFHEPGLVVGRELQRGRAGPDGQQPDVLAHLSAEVHERLLGLRRHRGAAHRVVAVRARAQAGGIRPDTRGVPQRENPVEPAQLERAVVADAVAPRIGHGVDGHHGGEVRRVGDGHGVLRAPGVGRPDGADAPAAPRLFAYPLGQIGTVRAVVPQRAPASFGAVAAPHVLDHGDVAAPHKKLRPAVCAAVLVVRGALNNRGEALGYGYAPAGGHVDVGREFHPVAHRHHHIPGKRNLVARLALGADRLRLGGEQE